MRVHIDSISNGFLVCFNYEVAQEYFKNLEDTLKEVERRFKEEDKNR